MMTSGTVKSAASQNRRVMSRSSSLSSSSPVAAIGSSAMPHLGQLPGSSRTISGCIGQVHFVAAGAGATGSSAIPHLGQLPGPSCRISGCIGHVCSIPPDASSTVDGVVYRCGSASNFDLQRALQNRCSRPSCSTR